MLGLTRRQLLGQILFEGTILGVIGSLAGLALGYATAAAALNYFGGDLGGGFFPGVKPSVHFDPFAAIFFSRSGSALLCWAAPFPHGRRRARTPHPHSSPGVKMPRSPGWALPGPVLLCLASGVLFTQLPPSPICQFSVIWQWHNCWWEELCSCPAFRP